MNALHRPGPAPETPAYPGKRAARPASRRWLGPALALAGLGLIAACGTSPGATRDGQPAAADQATSRTGTAGTGTAGGTIAGQPAGPPAVRMSQVQTGDGSLVTVATFAGPVQYVLHDGSQDPRSPRPVLLHAGPAIGSGERSRLLAAFNGGFLMRSRAGGYEQEGHLFRGLRHGLASLVIDRSGHARIGVWGAGVPVPGESVYSVRQNLWPLVMDGRRTPETDKWWRWGGTVVHVESVARSALGQNAAGELIYAAGMSTTPADLADALVRSGAQVAMELDINPEWVQLDTAAAPGTALATALPRQVRPASQYLTGWTRDFIAVLAPAGTVSR